MSLARYGLLLATVVVLGLVAVWGHLRLVAVGYDVNELRSRRARLEEESRMLERRIESMTAPDVLRAKVKALRLDLAPDAEASDSGPPATQPSPPLAGDAPRDARASPASSGNSPAAPPTPDCAVATEAGTRRSPTGDATGRASSGRDADARSRRVPVSSGTGGAP